MARELKRGRVLCLLLCMTMMIFLCYRQVYAKEEIQLEEESLPEQLEEEGLSEQVQEENSSVQTDTQEEYEHHLNSDKNDEEVEEVEEVYEIEDADEGTLQPHKEGSSVWAMPVKTASYNGPAVVIGAGQLEGGQSSNIYFGNYQQSSAGKKKPAGTKNVDWIQSSTAVKNDQGPYYWKEPVKWRVLSNNENGSGKLFLLSDQNLDVRRYHSSCINIRWKGCTLRTWLNGTFLKGIFSSGEQSGILQTDVINDDNPDHGTEGGANTSDRVFLLSIAEASNSSYFLNGNSSRISTNTAYVAGGGSIGSADMYNPGQSDAWWLRSPGLFEDRAAGVPLTGEVMGNGMDVDCNFYAIRPAINLNLNAVLLTSAAVESNQGVIGTVLEVGTNTANEWKVTLKDSQRSFSASTVDKTTQKEGYAEWIMDITYSGAKTGSNEYVSAMLADSSNSILYYGRIVQNSTEGTAKISLPTGLGPGSYTLKLFSEQYNGDYKTGYGSEFQDISISVMDTTQPALSDGTATRESETHATVRFISDDEGTFYYLVVDSGTQAPADLTTSGISGACTKGENSISLDRLTAGKKDIYIIIRNKAGNVSEKLKIVIPPPALGAPQNLQWDGHVSGKVTWDAVKDAAGYSVQLYKDSTAKGEAASVTATEHIFNIGEAGSYTFKVKAAGGEDYSDSQEAHSGLQQFFSVVFDTDGGSAVSTQFVVSGGRVVKPQTAVKKNYTLEGWYSDKSFAADKKWDFETNTVTQDSILYARWNPASPTSDKGGEKGGGENNFSGTEGTQSWDLHQVFTAADKAVMAEEQKSGVFPRQISRQIEKEEKQPEQEVYTVTEEVEEEITEEVLEEGITEAASEASDETGSLEEKTEGVQIGTGGKIAVTAAAGGTALCLFKRKRRPKL